VGGITLRRYAATTRCRENGNGYPAGGLCARAGQRPRWEEDARYIAGELLKNYKRVALIDHGAGNMEVGRAHAKEMAEVFGLAYEEIPGSLDYLRRLVHGPWDDDFIRVPPGSAIDPFPYMTLHSIALP